MEKNPFAKFWNTPRKFSPPKSAYYFDKKAMKAERYRLNHPIARRMLEDITLNYRDMPADRIVFDLSGYEEKISVLEPLKDKRGVMAVYDLSVSSIDHENHVICVAFDNEGNAIPHYVCELMWSLSGTGSNNYRSLEYLKEDLRAKNINREEYDEALERYKEKFSNYISQNNKEKLEVIYENVKTNLISDISARNTDFFGEEMDKLDKWARDVKQSMEKQIIELDNDIAQLKKRIRNVSSIDERLGLEKQVKDLEARRNKNRLDLYGEQDEIGEQKDKLIAETQARLGQRVRDELLFTIEWEIT